MDLISYSFYFFVIYVFGALWVFVFKIFYIVLQSTKNNILVQRSGLYCLVLMYRTNAFHSFFDPVMENEPF